MKMLVLIADAFRESRRKKLFWVALYVSLAAAAALAPFQFREDGLYFFASRWTEGYDLPETVTRIEPSLPRHLDRDTVVVMVLLTLQTFVLGWAGIVLWVSATAGFLPDFLQAGRVDLTLARPVSRWQVLLAKYLGALALVAIQAGLFVGLTCLVVSLNSGRFYGGYLAVWPLVVHQFACLLPICLAIGLASRSTVFAILGTLGFSMLCFGASTLAPHVGEFGLEGSWIGHALHALYLLLPKPQDVSLIAQEAMGFAARSGASGQALLRTHPAVSLASSGIVPAAAMAWAMRRFHKMDC